jgi:myo-inositol-1-phosphate synthase
MNGNSNIDNKKVKVAIAGVGNCASALLQGISFYGNTYRNDNDKKGNNQTVEGVVGQNIPEGLIAYTLGDIKPGDIEFVAGFDVVESKVGHDLADAIFASPNNTIKISNVPTSGIKVDKGKSKDIR